MAQPPVRCKSCRKGVFHDVDATLTIHERDVKARRRQLAVGFAGKKIRRRGTDTRHLAGCQVKRCLGMRGTLLDLDEDDLDALARDQVDLAGSAAPAPCANRTSRSGVMLFDGGLGGHTGMVRRCTAHARGQFGAGQAGFRVDAGGLHASIKMSSASAPSDRPRGAAVQMPPPQRLRHLSPSSWSMPVPRPAPPSARPRPSPPHAPQGPRSRP